METPRIIPILLLKGTGLYKTLKFKEPKYIGDPLNAVKIFNDKEVDELIILDITASLENKKPNYELLYQMAGECFMPLGYGGAVSSIEEIRKLISMGIEKVSINSNAVKLDFIREAADVFGSSTIVVSMDVKKNFWGKYEVYTKSGTSNTKMEASKFAVEINKAGAGELLVNSIDRDGVMQGYDLDLIKSISGEIDIPLIACGGAGELNHFKQAVNAGASAAAAGSMFVFHGKHRAVLISYPEQSEINALFR
ncbi:MAG: imidazole glycerol phosphate synthase subunit HisF [Bacteroidota bacterium]|jgi:cyclase|nr:imidazole glycerol phosphate synthase subunit HisF [Bacteroidota bacterium]